MVIYLLKKCVPFRKPFFRGQSLHPQPSRAAFHVQHLHETRRQRCSPRGKGQQSQARGTLGDLILDAQKNDDIYQEMFNSPLMMAFIPPHFPRIYRKNHDKSVWIKKHCAFSKNTHDFNGDFTLHIAIHPEVHQRFGCNGYTDQEPLRNSHICMGCMQEINGLH